MEFSRQDYWSRLPFPYAGDIPDPGLESWSPALQADSLPSELPESLVNVRFPGLLSGCLRPLLLLEKAGLISIKLDPKGSTFYLGCCPDNKCRELPPSTEASNFCYLQTPELPQDLLELIQEAVQGALRLVLTPCLNVLHTHFPRLAQLW